MQKHTICTIFSILFLATACATTDQQPVETAPDTDTTAAAETQQDTETETEPETETAPPSSPPCPGSITRVCRGSRAKTGVVSSVRNICTASTIARAASRIEPSRTRRITYRFN